VLKTQVMSDFFFLLDKIKPSKFLFVASLRKENEDQDDGEIWDGKIQALIRMFKNAIVVKFSQFIQQNR